MARSKTRSQPSIEIVDAAALGAEPEAWDDLMARAIEPHPHFSRHVIEAHARAGLLREDIAFVAVRNGGRLDALLPFRNGLDITGLGRLVAQPALSPFMPSSAPLVAAERLPETLTALVDGLAEASRGRAWRWPLLTISGTVGRGLLDAMRETGWAIGTVVEFERPVLDLRPSHDAFLKDHPNKSRLKDLRRRQRRMAEAGQLDLVSATEGEALTTALEDFLALELAGWKGEAGTALACRPKTLALAHALFADRPGPVGVRADTLSLDGRPLAVSLALVAGGTANLLKTAYDERERALAPGLVLEAEIVRAFHETPFAQRLDSATLAGSALESLYRERETVAEIVAVPPGGDARLSVERRVSLARFEHRARAEAKRLLKRG
ncbi:GNAT family N-acetyltransferase [Methylobacterium sp. C25]|uniref:GNAT family N-acetyltransferase n=1 Tax=Methylobacterium sp. C25 TaxID=2721622 RepID=UPI001F291F9F|nr:GNAT family N-acetyltransferase [Methylobacterium sp. C25]